MIFEYKPKGVCSRNITLEMNGNTIERAEFLGGCNGNLKGVCALIRGKEAGEIVELLKGIHCGDKNTSCPDQLSLALESYMGLN